MKTESTVRIDAKRNRVYLTLVGYQDVEEARRMRDLYTAAVQSMEPGFTVLVDVTRYKPGSPAVAEVHREAVRAAEEAGVRRVARVVGTAPLGGMQIERIARAEAQYESQNFATFEEAEAYLDARAAD